MVDVDANALRRAKAFQEMAQVLLEEYRETHDANKIHESDAWSDLAANELKFLELNLQVAGWEYNASRRSGVGLYDEPPVAPI